MSKRRSLVVVGAGLAGAKAAEFARKNGFDGDIALIGDEPGLPYERPSLSKDVLRGEKDFDSANVHDAQFYETNKIDLVHATAEHLTNKEVGTSVGRFAFDVAVLATGAKARHLEVPGADLQGVCYLRTRDDSLHLHEEIRSATRICVIGGGWIGAEVAASARQMGASVLLVDNGPALLSRFLGDEIGQVFQQLHVDNGVVIRSNISVVAIHGGDKVDAIELSDGSREYVDLVVAGIGAIPEVRLAEAAGLQMANGGVTVDEFLRTSSPNIYVAGDIANAWHPFYRRHIRFEHWANALNQGKRAGANIAGEAKPYNEFPYFYSDQFDLGMECIGVIGREMDVAVRGDLDGRKFIAFWHNGGVVSAAMNVNIWDVVEESKMLIRSRKSIDPSRLSDASIPLAELI